MSEEGQPNNDTPGSGSPPSGGLGQAGSPTPNSDWINSLDEGLRTDPTITNLKAENAAEALNKLANMTINAQKLVGQNRIPQLSNEIPFEQKQDWFKQHLGSPIKADDYVFGEHVVSGKNEAGEDVKIEVDPALTAQVRAAAHAGALTPEQAAAVHNTLALQAANQTETSQKDLEAQIIKDLGELNQEWGPAYDANMATANFAYSRILPETVQKIINDLPQLTNHPDFIKTFEKLGRSMRDDTIRGDSGASDPGVQNSHQALSAIRQMEDSPEWKQVLAGTADAMTTERLQAKRTALYAVAYPG